MGNAKVGAGGRQRGYLKAGRVKRQAANGQSKWAVQVKTGETLRMSAGAKQDFAPCVGKCAAYMWVSK